MVFKDETGLPSQPPFATLPRIIPGLVPESTLPYPLNNIRGHQAEIQVRTPEGISGYYHNGKVNMRTCLLLK
jgi:hypothetical protein